MIQIDNLTFGYSRHHIVLSNFSLELKPGLIYGLLGLNGSGKSTLLYMMSGLLTPQKGQVKLDGVNVRQRKPVSQQDIYLVPDEFELPPVLLSQYIRTQRIFYPNFSEADMKTYLQCFNMTEDVHLNALSLGQKKKVFMSFAMAIHTHVLLMDEPTNGLDIPGKEQFRKFIRMGITPDTTFVISTHQVKDVEQVIDHVLMLSDSKIIADKSTAEISGGGELDLEKFFTSTLAKDGKEAAE
jgi:ABC-2 type transport system ATP-binding protein